MFADFCSINFVFYPNKSWKLKVDKHKWRCQLWRAYAEMGQLWEVPIFHHVFLPKIPPCEPIFARAWAQRCAVLENIGIKIRARHGSPMRSMLNSQSHAKQEWLSSEWDDLSEGEIRESQEMSSVHIYIYVYICIYIWTIWNQPPTKYERSPALHIVINLHDHNFLLPLKLRSESWLWVQLLSLVDIHCEKHAAVAAYLPARHPWGTFGSYGMYNTNYLKPSTSRHHYQSAAV